ncbi:hypothetical protein [Streptomyces sp. NPDC048845]|uniref:hypothetical protein n=1 Tax=Streptomyces sp. NPDC048845 TaxID=3155390 RepID=UPI00342C8709
MDADAWTDGHRAAEASGVGLEFLTGEPKGTHVPFEFVFTVPAAMSGTEREYIRDRALEGPVQPRPTRPPP